MQSAEAAQYRERLKSPAKAQQIAAPALQTSNSRGKSLVIVFAKPVALRVGFWKTYFNPLYAALQRKPPADR
jgi:hypothetical protein